MNGQIVLALAWRSIVNVGRMPSAFVPSVVMPIVFVVVFSGAFSAITNLPNFDTDNILNWYAPMTILQGSAFAGLGTAFGTARDLEDGFFDRLLLAPTSEAGGRRCWCLPSRAGSSPWGSGGSVWRWR